MIATHDERRLRRGKQLLAGFLLLGAVLGTVPGCKTSGDTNGGHGSSPFDLIDSFGRKKQELVDKSRSHYREALEQSGIRHDEMLEKQKHQPVVSDRAHLDEVAKKRREREEDYRKSVAYQNSLVLKRSKTKPGSPERAHIDAEIIRTTKQNAAILRDVGNLGGDPDELKRNTHRPQTTMSEDAADLFLPGYSDVMNPARQAARNAQQEAVDAARRQSIDAAKEASKKAAKSTRPPRDQQRPSVPHGPESSHSH